MWKKFLNLFKKKRYYLITFELYWLNEFKRVELVAVEFEKADIFSQQKIEFNAWGYFKDKFGGVDECRIREFKTISKRDCKEFSLQFKHINEALKMRKEGQRAKLADLAEKKRLANIAEKARLKAENSQLKHRRSNKPRRPQQQQRKKAKISTLENRRKVD